MNNRNLDTDFNNLPIVQSVNFIRQQFCEILLTRWLTIQFIHKLIYSYEVLSERKNEFIIVWFREVSFYKLHSGTKVIDFRRSTSIFGCVLILHSRLLTEKVKDCIPIRLPTERLYPEFPHYEYHSHQWTCE